MGPKVARVTIQDQYEITDLKIKLENEIFKIILDNLPNHRIADPIHPYRSYYDYFADQDGQVARTYLIEGEIVKTSFGILGPKPVDKRPKILELIPIGFAPLADLVGTVTILYDDDTEYPNTIYIEIYGLINKKPMTKMAQTISRFLKNNTEIEIKLVDSEPRQEKTNYLN